MHWIDAGKKGTEDLYDEEYYQRRKEYFFRNVVVDPEQGRENSNIQEFGEALKHLAELAPSRGQLLDVGCGIGIFLSLARKDHWQVMGVDVSHFACRYAQEVFGVDAHQGDLRAIGFPSGRFDCVTMWDTLEHLQDPLAMLGESGRLLKSGGYLLLNTPNEEGLLRVLARALYEGSFETFQYPVRKLYHIYHLYYFTEAVLRNVLEQSGFRILRLKKKPIAAVKARGTWWEKAIVKALAPLEILVGREYELFVLAQKH